MTWFRQVPRHYLSQCWPRYCHMASLGYKECVHFVISSLCRLPLWPQVWKPMPSCPPRRPRSQDGGWDLPVLWMVVCTWSPPARPSGYHCNNHGLFSIRDNASNYKISFCLEAATYDFLICSLWSLAGSIQGACQMSKPSRASYAGCGKK